MLEVLIVVLLKQKGDKFVFETTVLWTEMFLKMSYAIQSCLLHFLPSLFRDSFAESFPYTDKGMIQSFFVSIILIKSIAMASHFNPSRVCLVVESLS